MERSRAGEKSFISARYIEWVCFAERHADKSEKVRIEYSLENGQYGIFAQEFRNPIAGKQDRKTADALACIIDEECKKNLTVIFDVKSNISAFSDDLLKDGAMLTVIKQVRDFTKLRRNMQPTLNWL